MDPALDPAGGAAIDIAGVARAAAGVAIVPALEAEQALVEPVVVVPLSWYVLGLRGGGSSRARRGEAGNEKRADQNWSKKLGAHMIAFAWKELGHLEDCRKP